MRWARYRKMIVAAIGTAAGLVVLIPEDMLPEQWRPWVGILLGVATVLGVRQVRNAPPTRADVINHLPTRAAHPSERRKPPFEAP